MASIKGKNTKPELIIRTLLHKNGYRYRLHRKDLPGNPDIVLPKYKAVIQVNGCYWHGHDCKRYNKAAPKTNTRFWQEKVANNKVRDINNNNKLLLMGWRVCIFWECSLNRKNYIDGFLAQKLFGWIEGDTNYIEFSQAN